MKAKTLRHRAAMLALATVTMLTLSGCASEAPAAVASKSATLYSRDTHLCLLNETALTVTVNWTTYSTNSGSGPLAPGASTCGEGPLAMVDVTFSDGIPLTLKGENPDLGSAYLDVRGPPVGSVAYCSPATLVCGVSETFVFFAHDTYSEFDTIAIEAHGHHFSVTRDANDDWVNFTATILD